MALWKIAPSLNIVKTKTKSLPVCIQITIPKFLCVIESSFISTLDSRHWSHSGQCIGEERCLPTWRHYGAVRIYRLWKFQPEANSRCGVRGDTGLWYNRAIDVTNRGYWRVLHDSSATDNSEYGVDGVVIVIVLLLNLFWLKLPVVLVVGGNGGDDDEYWWWWWWWWWCWWWWCWW